MVKRSVSDSSRGAEHDVNVEFDDSCSTNGAIKVSIVVVNKDERLLGETLDAMKPFVGRQVCEVLVVDASNFALDDIRLANEWARWIDYAQPSGVRTTIAHQRNIGVRDAIGDVIVFTDSGCLPEDGWLENLLAPILEGRESVTCGPARGIGRSIYSGDRWSGNIDHEYATMAPTINLAFRREAFEAVGGFDESFGSGEDVDFTWRLIDHGYRLRWVRDAVVTHDWGTTARQLRRAYFYGHGACRLLRKHPHRIVAATKENSVPVLYGLFLAGLPLTLKWRWYPLLLLWPIWRQRDEELHWLVLLDHLAQGAGVLHEFLRPGT
jgi:cellulose synthase/poly-beta-1,6-N-acetylglucosamine synthase-like glycosyltransferase